MNDTALYLLIFGISVTVAVVVGQVLYSSGEPFLAEVFGDETVAASVNKLLIMLFHLLTLGVLALISTADMDVEGQAQGAVTKLGLMLLVVGGAHAVAMRVLLHARHRRMRAELAAQFPPAQFPPPQAYGPPFAPPAPYPPAG